MWIRIIHMLQKILYLKPGVSRSSCLPIDQSEYVQYFSYIRHTRTKRIVLRVDRTMIMKVFIDAEYEAH